jgi:hypothetical protein
MKAAVDPIVNEVLDFIESSPNTFCIERTPKHYEALLGLYETIGYGPEATHERLAWQEASKTTWSMIDAILPGSTTCGAIGLAMPSSWSSISIAPGLTYMHSICMEKTLEGVVSLFAQAIKHLARFDRLKDSEYLAAGYACRSHFTSTFQRPKNFKIPSQIQIDTLLCCQREPKPRTPGIAAMLRDTTMEDEELLAPNQKWAFRTLSRVDTSLAALRSVKRVTLRSHTGNKHNALVLLQSAPPLMMAEDIHREALVFPVADTNIVDLCRLLRGLQETCTMNLYFFLPPTIISPPGIQGEVCEASFWAATAKKDRHLLLRSYREAFGPVLDKYPSSELKHYLT